MAIAGIWRPRQRQGHLQLLLAAPRRAAAEACGEAPSERSAGAFSFLGFHPRPANLPANVHPTGGVAATST
jgi:hypothetical protein